MRTAVCPKCGAKHLKWAENSLGVRYLVDFDSGVEHYRTCPGVRVQPERSSERPDFDDNQSERDSDSKPEPTEKSEPEPSESESPSDSKPEPEPSDSSESDSSESDSSESEPDSKPEPKPEPDSKPEPSEDETEPEIKAPSEPEPKRTEHRMQRELDRLAAIRPALNIMLVGPAGGGKTTACRIAAERAGLNYTERSMGPATSQWDLLGFQSPTTGNYVPGILRQPYEAGGMLALDEVDNSNPSVPTAWNSALANGHFTFPDNIEVARHPDFVCVACANTYGRGADRLYVGRQQLDAATLDRFVILEWDYDESQEIAWAGGDAIAREWVPYVQRIRAKAFELRERFVVSPRASIYGARMLRAGVARKQVEESAIWKGATSDLRAKLGQVR